MNRASSAARAPAHDHVVQFYGDDRDLAESAGSYLIDAVAASHATVVVATPAHRAAFEARLAAAGVDVPAAIAGGQLHMLDAEATMRQFLINDRPDAAAFRAVLTGLIGEEARRGRPTHIYGEMVGLLWESGLLAAALELETLWNDLARELPFSLFCAYSSRSVTGEHEMNAICQLHSALVGPLRARPDPLDATPAEAVRNFSPTTDAPRAARRFVTETLRAWGRQRLVDDASVVVTELATNAVVHARSDFTVSLLRTRDSVRIGVRDAGSGVPVPRVPSTQEPSGRGLGLVGSIANRWDVEKLPHGKEVWADLGADTTVGLPLGKAR